MFKRKAKKKSRASASKVTYRHQRQAAKWRRNRRRWRNGAKEHRIRRKRKIIKRSIEMKTAKIIENK